MKDLRSLDVLFVTALVFLPAALAADVPSVTVGTFEQEVCTVYTAADGLVSDNALAVAVTGNGTVYAGTAAGLAVFKDDAWQRVADLPETTVSAVAANGDGVLAAAGEELYRVGAAGVEPVVQLPEACILALAGSEEDTYVATCQGLYKVQDKRCRGVRALNDQLGNDSHVNAIAINGDTIAVAANSGLFLSKDGRTWTALEPTDGVRSWAPRDVRGVAFDAAGNLWYASPQGVGEETAEGWNLYTGAEGLPYNDFTGVAADAEGTVWFGTRIGAIHYDGHEWMYRQGRRWLPNDKVRSLAVTPAGDAWFATPGGVGVIRCVPMTLAEKAKFYEEEIDKYNRRTEYGYVLDARVEKPGDKSKWSNHDSDNDGLWTSMYGAGECFGYAATKDPKAKQRAKNAFEALRFLSVAPVGGEVKQQPGFVARTVVPTTEKDPNEGYTIERMQKNRDTGDKLWKVYYPRWPLTKDGKYWYKTDTSSDELDGHYFFYALYYDLVADTPEEKALVAEVVRNITDHLARNDFALIDHDGKPTRWSVFSPDQLNRNPWWIVERGLNSLSMLSYLTVAQHITGDPKYGKLVDRLCDKYYYDINAMVAKIQRGPGSGNQSDDEMAFMSFYNLIRYTQDKRLKEMMTYSFYSLWVLEFPELNPFFNLAYASQGLGAEFTNAYGTYDLSPWPGWLEDSVETLKRFPLDRFNWAHRNDHRLDIIRLRRQILEPQEPASELEREPRGYRVNGKVLPVDERFFGHWNTNPWDLNYGGDGRSLADGAAYLLPYYMGLYHGFIRETS